MPRLATYQPDIAPNLASMIRTAACLGVPVDVIGPCGFPFSAKAYRRTVMDYEAQADVTHHVDWDAFLAARPPGRLVLLSTSGERGLWDHGFLPGDTLLMGRESAGVPPEVAARADVILRIPMPGGGRSLNVAVSAAIALAEAVRQTAHVVPAG
ncbi:tRNA (cytidine(34)-2'-O)-methyltransferase [Oceanibium sediminis]|uniref:tRNA (cytidine(34)-2'-O)-methyltransferase n=1 Tax=Oceanibium sediminis TaxID=2026339 RepID=UPI000DD3EF1F|nr:tRNA (cytidine(34)-2'-O)-methyltransferase [Oceanibium sediminis]